MAEKLNKTKATEKAIELKDKEIELKRLKLEHDIDKLEKAIKGLRTEIGTYTMEHLEREYDDNGKEVFVSYLMHGVKVTYTPTHDFNKDLFKAQYPDIDLDSEEFKSEGTRYKKVSV